MGTREWPRATSWRIVGSSMTASCERANTSSSGTITAATTAQSCFGVGALVRARVRARVSARVSTRVGATFQVHAQVWIRVRAQIRRSRVRGSVAGFEARSQVRTVDDQLGRERECAAHEIRLVLVERLALGDAALRRNLALHVDERTHLRRTRACTGTFEQAPHIYQSHRHLRPAASLSSSLRVAVACRGVRAVVACWARGGGSGCARASMRD
eukprot:710019-Prymnesium_polylepis.1